MTHANVKTLRDAHARYIKSNLYTLADCYTSNSRAKENAFAYCRELVEKYNGRQGRIIGYNSQTFSYGFIGYIGNKQAFFYITKDYDRFILVDELED